MVAPCVGCVFVFLCLLCLCLIGSLGWALFCLCFSWGRCRPLLGLPWHWGGGSRRPLLCVLSLVFGLGVCRPLLYVLCCGFWFGGLPPPAVRVVLCFFVLGVMSPPAVCGLCGFCVFVVFVVGVVIVFGVGGVCDPGDVFCLCVFLK